MYNFVKDNRLAAVHGVLSSTAATSYSDQVDMANFESVTFVGLIDTTAGATGTGTFAAVGTDTSTAASTDYEAITGASVTIAASTAGTKKFVALEVSRPRHRYLKCKLTRTAKCYYCGTIAIQHGPRLKPVAHSTATQNSTAAVVLVVPQTT